MTIPLGRPSPGASRDRPGWQLGSEPGGQCPPRHPYLVLLPVGFAVPLPLPGTRCALTAPFHPCRRGFACQPREGHMRRSAGGLFSVALSLGLPPPGVTRHRASMEPGLSSPGLAPEGGHPAVWPSLSMCRKEARQRRPRQRRMASSRAEVSPSSRPSAHEGRKWRWKARITETVGGSSAPLCGTA